MIDNINKPVYEFSILKGQVATCPCNTMPSTFCIDWST